MSVSAQAARFAVFASLFAGATILDHAQLGTEFGANAGTLAIGAGIAVLLRPAALAPFTVLLVAQAAYFAAAFPKVSNLGLTHLFLCTTTLCGLGLLLARRGAERTDGGHLLATVEPALRLELLVLYFWSFWHKLNADFFDPEISCAVDLYEKVRFGLSFLPLPEGKSIATLLMVATLAIEGGLVVLLALRRTRSAGVALGTLFHLVLGFGYFYAFSAGSIAVLFLFAPEALAERVAALHTLRSARLHTLAIVLLIAAVALLRAAYSWHPERALLENLAGIDRLGNQFCQRLWWLYVPVAACIAASVFARSTVGARELLVPSRRVLLVFPILFFLNGVSPYVGFKTESSFAMYSNLRTEGGRSNHFLVRTPLDLFDYQRDLVQIRSSSHPDLARWSGRTVPFVLLRLRVHDVRGATGHDFALAYLREGRVHEVPSAAAAPEFARPPNWFERKFLVFRDIQSTGCGH